MRKQLIKFTALDFQGRTDVPNLLLRILVPIVLGFLFYGNYLPFSIGALLCAVLYILGRFLENKYFYSIPRVAYIAFPSICISGYLMGLGVGGSIASIPAILSVILIIFSELYFKYNPLKWEELDDTQKHQLGKFKYNRLTEEQKEEWIKLNEKFQ